MSQNAVTKDQQTLLRQASRQVSLLWWMPLLSGLCAVALGLAILATDCAVKALVVIVGLLFVIYGVTLALSPVYARDSRGEQVLAGLLEVAAGVVLLAWPQPTFLVLAVFAGIWLAVAGGFHIVTSIARRHTLPSWGLTATIGVIELLLGLWVMRRPEAPLNLVIVVLGLWAVLTGVLDCVLAFEMRRMTRQLTAAAEAGAGDLGRVRESVERLYAEGRLSGWEYATLTEVIVSSGPSVEQGPATPQPPS